MKKLMKKILIGIVFLIVIAVVPCAADVAPGDVINKENWQKIEGMVPETVLNYVKRGDFDMKIVELQYDPKTFYQGWKTGKYEPGRFVVKDSVVFDTKTQKLSIWDAQTIPFQDLDVKDPLLGVKYWFNKKFFMNAAGNQRVMNTGHMMARSGYESSFKARQVSYIFKEDNKKDFSDKRIVLFEEPYDIAGTAMLIWIYNNPKTKNKNFAYSPVIRRVRRMSPSGTSDPMLGSDLCMDDLGGFLGEPKDFDFTLIEEKNILAPFLSEKAYEVIKREDGSYESTDQIKPTIFGYQKEGWTGAPWAVTNMVWAKRKAYLFEVTPKNSKYNHGKIILWVDTDFYMEPYKIIYDRGKKYWKTMTSYFTFLKHKDSDFRVVYFGGHIMVDDRKDHASIMEGVNNMNKSFMNLQDVNPADFTMGGFTKYCR